ncbi:CPBP family intramembrane glutamic endopeptidase [Cohnella sp. AR92]|uniref:CPBP family intramembrane glutamic endopeptidase n=1 Tax=Cohnella sp. AR92 TaxID=648716 RepID=UPI000F8F4127|nr:type II CAAX endopeptidase family protein [Cohnella sp. AR92]RUS47487.1 CPBP family intramembrane metalloprotease [Cohnella sp. AR92]
MKERFAVIGKILLSLVIMIVLASIGTILLQAIDTEDSNAQMLVSSLSVMGAALLMFYLFDRKKGWSLGLNRKRTRTASNALLGLGLGILTISISFAGIWLFGGLEIESAHLDADTVTGVALSFGAFILVAFGEEMLCRGYVQGLIKNRYGANPAILFSSLFFALMHLANPDILSTPFPLINIFLIGLIFAIAREKTNGLWLPIGFHFSWNFLQGNVYGFAVSGEDIKTIMTISPHGSTYLSGGDFGAEGSAVVTVLMLIVLAAALRSYKRRESIDPSKYVKA